MDNLIRLWNEKTAKNDLCQKQQELDTIFEQAVEALIREEISQESFRTFNEVYKDVREAIEKDVREAIERKIQGS